MLMKAHLEVMSKSTFKPFLSCILNHKRRHVNSDDSAVATSGSVISGTCKNKTSRLAKMIVGSLSFLVVGAAGRAFADAPASTEQGV